MFQHPEVKAGEWLHVGSAACVVTNVYPIGAKNGVCLVVFNKNKPTTHVVDWDGERWFFPERPDYGGYAKESDPFVQQLKGMR
jgi:hypothetical protein